MSCAMLLYVISISCQLSGALLLLLNSLTKLTKQIPSLYFASGQWIEVDKDNKPKYDIEKVREILTNILLNRASFFNLVIGYTVTAFTSIVSNTFETLIGIICLTFIIITIEYYGMKHKAKVITNKIIEEIQKENKLPNGACIIKSLD